MTETSMTQTKQRVGLALAGLLSVLNLSNLGSFVHDAASGDVGPSNVVELIDVALGVIGIVAVVRAWRGSRRAMRVAAGVVGLITLTALPGLFVDVPIGWKLLVGVSVLLSVVAVLLMFSGPRRPVAALD